MNLFEIVKYGVSCREAAERYGVEMVYVTEDLTLPLREAEVTLFAPVGDGGTVAFRRDMALKWYTLADGEDAKTGEVLYSQNPNTRRPFTVFVYEWPMY